MTLTYQLKLTYLKLLESACVPLLTNHPINIINCQTLIDALKNYKKSKVMSSHTVSKKGSVD